MPDAYDYITLMCRLKVAQARNKELESGERYIQLKELHQKECRVYEHKIQKLESAIADAHKETIRVRNYWFQVLEDMLLEFESMQKKAAQELQEMEKRALLAEKQRDDALDKVKELRIQFYETAARLEEEQGKNLKLRAQINRDYENSSIPSSKTIKRKKITNSREKSGRKFLSDLTGGKLNISKGMVSKLSKEFALKTEPERRSACADMLLSPVMHTDCTNARENGKSCYVYVCATPDGKTLYFARRKKGHEGVNREGYNLFLRMEKYMRNHLLFLHDLRIPATNNEAERLLRNYKRKQAQAVTFRSFESIDYLCQCMSMLILMRLEEPENIFDRVSKMFG